MQHVNLENFPPLDRLARQEMRASYAGETGAVWIYRGILTVNGLSNNRTLSEFARHHLQEESEHLALYEAQIHRFRGSLLQLFWIMAGFITGALPALLGNNWVYFTIYKVESFVDRHYQEQIHLLQTQSKACTGYENCIALFRYCHVGELRHKEEAKACLATSPGIVMRLWGKAIEVGSAIGVMLARRI